MRNYKTALLYTSLFLGIFGATILGLSVVRPLASSKSTYKPWNPRHDREQIIFGGHMYSFISNSESIFNKISLYEPDLFIFGGDNVSLPEEKHNSQLKNAIEDASNLNINTLLIKGNHDDDQESAIYREKHYGVEDVGDIKNIYLDTNVESVHSDSCGFDDEQIKFLDDTLGRDTKKHTVLYMHHALWAYENYIGDEKVPTNIKYSCAGSFWKDQILPIIKGRVDAVVSSDGGVYAPFKELNKDDIKYVITGSPIHQRVNGGPDEGGPSNIELLRITTNDEELFISPITIVDETLTDESILEDIKTYSLTTNVDILKDLYKNSPLYGSEDTWQQQIEPTEVLDFVKQSFVANLDGEEVEINIRGNIGNHWEGYKKSWDINFPNSENRQVKLILPSDRGYINQMFVQQLSEWYGVPTPGITVSRLVVNDIDFGLYLEYEDFDKAFIELNGYNSNAIPSKNIFIDHFDTYYINSDVSSTTGDKQDKSYQRNLSNIRFTSKNINNYFDQDNYARWLAIQIILGDKHQNTSDNFRYFIDKPTGKYIMVTWDAYINKVDVSKPYNPTVYTTAFLENTENLELVKSYVQEFVDNSASFNKQLQGLINTYTLIFINDPGAEVSRKQIGDAISGLEVTYLDNIPKLKQWLAK